MAAKFFKFPGQNSDQNSTHERKEFIWSKTYWHPCLKTFSTNLTGTFLSLRLIFLHKDSSSDKILHLLTNPSHVFYEFWIHEWRSYEFFSRKFMFHFFFVMLNRYTGIFYSQYLLETQNKENLVKKVRTFVDSGIVKRCDELNLWQTWAQRHISLILISKNISIIISSGSSSIVAILLHLTINLVTFDFTLNLSSILTDILVF